MFGGPGGGEHGEHGQHGGQAGVGRLGLTLLTHPALLPRQGGQTLGLSLTGLTAMLFSPGPGGGGRQGQDGRS